MSRFVPRSRGEEERPNVKKAREELARIKGQRPAVEELVAELRREKALNNFTANVIITFRGGR